MTEKYLYCSYCHCRADRDTMPDLAFCPIHGWMPINFFEESLEDEDMVDDTEKFNEERKSEED